MSIRNDSDQAPIVVLLGVSAPFTPSEQYSWTFQSGDVIAFQSGDTVALNS